MKKLLVVVSVFLALGLAGAETAVARAEQEPIDVYGVGCIVDPGTIWFTGRNGQILHVRSRINIETLFDAETYVPVGINTVIVNLDLNQSTGSGGWSSSWSGHFFSKSETDPFIGTAAGYSRDFAFYGRIVGRGTGSLEGLKVKARLRPTSEVPQEILDQLPCFGDQLVGIWRDTGYFLNAR